MYRGEIFGVAGAIFLGVMCFATQAQAETSLHPLAEGGFVPQRLIVKFKNEKAQWDLLSEALRGQASSLRYSQAGALSNVTSLGSTTNVLRFSSALSVKEAASLMMKDPRVEWAQPDYYLSLFKGPNNFVSAKSFLETFSLGYDSSFKKYHANVFARAFMPSVNFSEDTNPVFEGPTPSPITGIADPMLDDAWGLSRISANTVWPQQKGERSFIVADIDTGVDYNHEDLRDNMWEGIGYDFADEDPFPWDTHGHGTHTSGTIAATGGNGLGISGVAQSAAIMAIRFIGSEGYGTTSGAVRSIDYAVQNGARVLSNSWGGRPGEDEGENQALKDAVQRASDAGVLFVAAAGNDGRNNDESPVYPAAYEFENVITVASTNDRDRRSFFSNFGERTVHVGAPGSNIISAIPGNRYQLNSGTSMACPHVAGLAVLVWSENPDLSAGDVKEIIMSSVDPLPSLQGITVSGGLVNAPRALERARNFGK